MKFDGDKGDTILFEITANKIEAYDGRVEDVLNSKDNEWVKN